SVRRKTVGPGSRNRKPGVKRRRHLPSRFDEGFLNGIAPRLARLDPAAIPGPLHLQPRRRRARKATSQPSRRQSADRKRHPVRRHRGAGLGHRHIARGYRSYRTMLDNRPDFFIHSGDHIYADCTIPSEQKLPNGEIWRNVVTEEKSEVAHTLAQFRGNYKYNHLDQHFRAFHAEVPMFAQWDDHEVTNDWSPTGSC